LAYQSRYKSEELDELFKAILTLEDEEDCYRFFEDLCTVKELRSIAQRLHVARLLSSKMKYTEIEERTKASTATISRINKCLMYGSDGYQRIIARLEKREAGEEAPAEDGAEA